MSVLARNLLDSEENCEAQEGREEQEKSSPGLSPEDKSSVRFISRYLGASNIPMYSGKQRDAAVQAWAVLYHSPDVLEMDKKHYRDCIIMNVFFFFPYVLRGYNLRACLFEDALQNMVLSVMSALDNFDPAYGTKFTWFILKYLKGVLRSAYQSDTVVRIPRSVRKAYVEAEYKNAEGSEGSDWEAKPQHKEVFQHFEEYADALEMDCQGTNDDPSLDDKVFSRQIMNLLEFALSEECTVLSEKEKVVITYRFGIFGTPKLTLAQVSELFRSQGWKASTEWIFQLQRKALGKLQLFFSRLNVECDF